MQASAHHLRPGFVDYGGVPDVEHGPGDACIAEFGPEHAGEHNHPEDGFPRYEGVVVVEDDVGASVVQGVKDPVGEAPAAAEVGGADYGEVVGFYMFQRVPVVYDVQMVAGYGL